MQTKRLVLLPFVEADLPDLLRYHTDPGVQTGYDRDGQPWSSEEIANRLASYIAAVEQFGFSRWKIALRSGEFAGRASLWWFEPDESVELGYGLLPAYWGQGYAREASLALIEWGFANLAIERIVAHTFLHNLQSRNLLLGLGMSYVGERIRSEKEGTCAFYELARTGWFVGR